MRPILSFRQNYFILCKPTHIIQIYQKTRMRFAKSYLIQFLHPILQLSLHLAAFINNFGLFIKASRDETHPKELQKILDQIEGKPYEALISKMMLRSMKQARYSTECTGHFGLSCKYYCHFTSPIRRYPDLQIHRIIKENLHGELSEKRIEHAEREICARVL